MKAFSKLYSTLDQTTKTNVKVAAMADYFRSTSANDAAWAIYFLTGRKPKSLIQTPKLTKWLIEFSQIPQWLFDECYETVGDLAETLAILFPSAKSNHNLSLSYLVEQRLLPLKNKSETEQKDFVIQAWLELDEHERYIYNKLMTGAFRVGVSQQLVVKAIANYAKLDAAVVSHRLMGTWEPGKEFFESLTSLEVDDTDISRPYPFYLAYPLQETPETLGDISEWQAEWKWDGIRSQIIKRQNQIFIWSRGEELVTDRYPELVKAAQALPDGTVLDGEILSWKEGKVAAFALLQQRIGRKVVSNKMLTDIPVILMAYDLLELENADWREKGLAERRAALVGLLNQNTIESEGTLKISPVLTCSNWQELQEKQQKARELNVEGLMIKRLSSAYKVGRQRGDWWKWKVDPYTIDAVLIYAQAGSGKRANLYTDYTFGVWDADKLVPIAKAYSGLDDEEIREVDKFVRKNTIEKFGPVRTVKPELVFELAFEAIQKSNRHKSGIAVRFPRIARWRQDKPATEADSLEHIKQLLV